MPVPAITAAWISCAATDGRASARCPTAIEPNRGFLRCVAALARAADSIGETDEYQRCLDLLDDCDPAARSELGLA